MDAPRKRAVERLKKLDRKLDNVDQDREHLDQIERTLKARARELNSATAKQTSREQSLAARQQEFNRQAISYAELQTENRLLRAELKNASVHAAFLEHLQQQHRAGATSVAEQRDTLGRAYFEEVVATARKAMTASNLPQNNQRVRTAAERVRALGVELTPAEERRALLELQTQFEKAVRAQEEREHQARLREQIREEQQREREIAAAEEAVRQAERERAAVAAALERALAQAHGQHAAEVDRLRVQLAEAEAKAQRAMSLAQQTKVGSVYVISNIGSFGEGVYKIGMSRRLDPMDRVKELGDASVPFPFDVHMMIRCDDAPALENALHKEFNHLRLNRMNPRKEFFRVSVDEVVKAVQRHHGTVDYTADADAIEFRNSQMATDADLGEIEHAFAAAGGNANANPDEE
jgi:chromosome segregation ATPase